MVKTLDYPIHNPLELNLSYITFINEGGLFIPTNTSFCMGDTLQVNLQLPNRPESLIFTGKVIWITPPNALYHVVPGIGVQFVGDHAKAIRAEIESYLEPSIELSGYTCGIIDSKSSTPAL